MEVRKKTCFVLSNLKFINFQGNIMKKIVALLFFFYSLQSFALFDPKISKNGKCLVTGVVKNEYCVNELVFFENDTDETTETGNGKIVKIKIDKKDKRPKAWVHVREGKALDPNTKLYRNLKGRVIIIDSSDLHKAELVKD